jgi:hypothetical protein
MVDKTSSGNRFYPRIITERHVKYSVDRRVNQRKTDGSGCSCIINHFIVTPGIRSTQIRITKAVHQTQLIVSRQIGEPEPNCTTGGDVKIYNNPHQCLHPSFRLHG